MLTPVISAIGHEADRPILDDIADARAATPTHAATLAVPDVAEVVADLAGLRARMRALMAARVGHERRLLDSWRLRKVLQDPAAILRDRKDELMRSRSRLVPAMDRHLARCRVDVGSLDLQLRALSPQATLDRGYALVMSPDGALVRESPPPGSQVNIRVQGGQFDATVDDVEGATDG